MARSNPANERLAVAEATLAAHVVADREMHDRIFEKLDELGKAVEVVRLQQGKQKSFVGGVVFVISALWAIAIVVLKFTPFGK